MGVIFLAGSYGVGKSTLSHELSLELNLPEYSAGDLISQCNGETYGANKVVKDKFNNQKILIKRVSQILENNKKIILAGHFCIFNRNNRIEFLPDFVYKNIYIEKIILLKAAEETIVRNLMNRDQKKYSLDNIKKFQSAEEQSAINCAKVLDCGIYIHNMLYDGNDVKSCLSYLQGEH